MFTVQTLKRTVIIQIFNEFFSIFQIINPFIFKKKIVTALKLLNAFILISKFLYIPFISLSEPSFPPYSSIKISFGIYFCTQSRFEP